MALLTTEATKEEKLVFLAVIVAVYITWQALRHGGIDWVINAVLAATGITILLAAIYGFVRFVKWAWMN